MTPRVRLLVLGVVVSACAGSPTGPSRPGNAGAIAGTWQGTMTFATPTPMTVPTTWTFKTLDQTAGMNLSARDWMGITTTATATVVSSQFDERRLGQSLDARP